MTYSLTRVKRFPGLKGFKIASLNVNNLLKHIDEIRHVLLSDNFVTNESKIDELISDNERSIPGYNLITEKGSEWSWRRCRIEYSE